MLLLVEYLEQSVLISHQQRNHFVLGRREFGIREVDDFLKSSHGREHAHMHSPDGLLGFAVVGRVFGQARTRLTNGVASALKARAYQGVCAGGSSMNTIPGSGERIGLNVWTMGMTALTFGL